MHSKCNLLSRHLLFSLFEIHAIATYLLTHNTFRKNHMEAENKTKTDRRCSVADSCTMKVENTNKQIERSEKESRRAGERERELESGREGGEGEIEGDR